MIHRSLFRACVAVLALTAAGACRKSPTDPSRPGTFLPTFLGVPAGAESFAPRAVDGGRVVGVAAGGGTLQAMQWMGGGFSPIGPAAPAGCHSEPTAARGGFTVGQVTCTATGEPGGQPVDAYGWIAGQAVPRLFAQPYTFVAVNREGAVAGTINPAAQFPRGERRAFVRTGGGVAVLLPPGANASEAVGITDAGQVVVNGFYSCLAAASETCYVSRVLAWSGGTWTEIPVPRRAERAVAAVAVSGGGEVAGYAFGEADQVFLYELDGGDMDVLPVIPGTRVLLTGANSREQVVGTGIRPEAAGRAASYGIVWGDNRQYDISERIGGTVGVRVTSALATDEEGRIAGTGVNLENGHEGAVLLVPGNL